MRDRKLLLSWVAGIAIAVLMFGFVLCALYLGREDVVAYDWNLDYLAVIIAFSPMLSAVASYAYLRGLILDLLGGPLGYWKSYRILFRSQLGPCLRGKVSSIMGFVHLSQKQAVSKVMSRASVNLQLRLQAVSGTMVFLVPPPSWKKMDSVVGSHVLSAFFFAGSVLLHRALVNCGLNPAWRATGQARMGLGWGDGYLLGQPNLWAVFWQVNGLPGYSRIEPICPSCLS
jgi:hypothetical protein